VPVVVVRQLIEPNAHAPPGVPSEFWRIPLPGEEPVPQGEESTDEILPSFDEALTANLKTTTILPPPPSWPSIAWERALLRTIEHPVLPSVIDSIADERFEYLVVEVPTGRSLWDAWDDPDVSNEQRFGWLAQLA